MNNTIGQWAKAASIRAIKTGAEVAGGFVIAGLAFSEIQWGYAASVTGVAMIGSLLWSIKGIPEVDDGASIKQIKDGE